MTFNSVYEITNNLSTVAGQHMIDYFTGNSLDDDRWHLRTVNGGIGGAMSDEIDGGYKVSFTTHTTSWGGLVFYNSPNYARSFNLQNFTCIVTAKRGLGSETGGFWLGMSNVINTTQNHTVAFSSSDYSGQTKFFLYRKGDVTNSIESDITIDDNWHTAKIQSTPNGTNLSIDGVLKVTGASGMGDYDCSPSLTGIDADSATHGQDTSFSLRYFEAWNT